MNILFVYNVKAGKNVETSIVDTIKNYLPVDCVANFVEIQQFDTCNTQSYHLIVAVGGDGTVNTVAKHCSLTNKTLGIIPRGSGDGLARFLGIPRDIETAVNTLIDGQKMSIDTGLVSNVFFVNVAGAGFEAKVAHRFGKKGIRGLRGYAKTILTLFNREQEKEVILTLNKKKTTLPFFSLTIANGKQWGNNFEIASHADIQDGLFEVAVMRKPKWYQIIPLMLYLKNNSQLNNRLFTYHRASKISVKRSGKKWHIDGEPIILKNKKKIVIQSKSLVVMVKK